MESAVGSPCQNRGPDFSALDPASSSLGHITAAAAAATVADGLHLLDQAPALGGFAQEPPVVVGIARGSILSLLLLLLGILHRPAPASETQSQASVAPSRAAHPHPPRVSRVYTFFSTHSTIVRHLKTVHLSNQGCGQTDLR